MRVAICGGTGFIGTHLTRALLGAGHEVVVVSRGGPAGSRRAPRPGVTPVRLDVTADDSGLSAALRGCDAAVNLVAVIHERGRQTFDRVNVQGTAAVAAAAAEAGVGHLVHVSAIGADPDPAYPYLASKWSGEQSVRLGASPYTVIRSGLVFGPGDAFFTHLTRAIRLSRVVAPIIGSGSTVFQPIAVDDLVRILVDTVEGGPRRAIVEVGGPEQLSFNDIVAIIKEATGLRRFDVHIPTRALIPMAFLMEKAMPRPPLTRGQLRMLDKHQITRRDAVSSNFGFTPRRLADAATYLEDY